MSPVVILLYIVNTQKKYFPAPTAVRWEFMADSGQNNEYSGLAEALYNLQFFPDYCSHRV